jgi:hypothetical protein
MREIAEAEFMAMVAIEHCLAHCAEHRDAVSPRFVRYNAPSSEFINANTYPPWAQETNGKMSFLELAGRDDLFAAVGFNPASDYFTTDRIIAYFCTACDVRVLKGGNHRLLQCARNPGDTRLLEVYEAQSADWTRCTLDMPFYCKCFASRR